MGHGGEVGGVGFEHEDVETLGGEGVADGLGVFVSDDAGERGAAAAGAKLAHFVGSMREAVKDDFFPVDAAFVDDAQAIGKGIAGMDDDGAGEFAREGELGAEGLFLTRENRGGLNGIFGKVKTVEPDFAEGDGTRTGGALKERKDLRNLGFPGNIFLNITRMEANGVIDVTGMGGGEVGVERPIFGAGADGDDAGDASGGGAVEHGGEIPAAGGFGEMAMGVDEHG